jgi:hypothetical protein
MELSRVFSARIVTGFFRRPFKANKASNQVPTTTDDDNKDIQDKYKQGSQRELI